MTPDQHPSSDARTAPVDQPGTPVQQLRSRPSFERAGAGYVQMLGEMRSALTALVPDLRWVSPVPTVAGGGLCGEPFSKVDGAATTSYTDHAKGRVPEAQWPQAWQQLTTIAARYGFTVPQVLPAPSSSAAGGQASSAHVAYIHDAWGGNFSILTRIDTVLGVDSPCLLHEAALPQTPSS